MDRWLCAALFGYSLSFMLSKRLVVEQWLLLTLGIGLLGIAVVCWRVVTQRSLLFLLGCVLCGIAWGTGNAYLHFERQLPPQLMRQNVTVAVDIHEITQVGSQFWRVQGALININGKHLSANPTVRLNWYEPPEQLRPPAAGTRWQFTARLKAPQGVRNDGGFLYHRYLVSREIHALGSIRDGHYVSGKPNIRQRLFNRLQQLQPNLQQFGVLLALMMGERQALTSAQWHMYQRTGLAHLIAISGLHLSLVAGGVLLVSQFASRYRARSRNRREQLNSWQLGVLLALVVAFCYAAMAGFATATLRAFAMFAVVIAHKRYAIHTPMSRVLLRAVGLVVLIEPYAWLQPGFWLSVSAVATIALMNWRWPAIQGRWRALRELWRLELVLTLLMWPLTVSLFGGLPLLAPITNLLVVPLVALWVLPMSLLAMLAALLNFMQATHWLLRLAELPLNYLEPVLRYLADAKWQWLASTHSGPVVLIGLLIVVWLWPWARRWQLAGSAVVLITLLVVQQLDQQRQHVALHVLDVDQGSAMVLQYGTYAMLIDTGANWELGGNMTERVVLPFLRHHRLIPELAFVSHTDNDHNGGVQILKTEFPHLRWFGSGTGSPCVAGQSGNWRKIRWQVLHPREVTANAHNDDSCVLLLTIDGTRVLIPGDITNRAERQLLAHATSVQADILLLAHHGSNSSSEHYFLQHVAPRFAIASRGRNNAYGMVAEPVKQRLHDLQIPLFDTALGGQLSVTFHSGEYEIKQPWAAQHGAWFDADN